MPGRLSHLMRTGTRRRRRQLARTDPAAERCLAREDLARRYLRGDGIEIGPLARPLRLPSGARVRYLDRLARTELIAERGEELAAAGVDPGAIPETDVLDDAEALASIDDGALDFVIANHVLQELEDPVATLQRWMRVLRPGGIVFLTLPDARYDDAGDAPHAWELPGFLALLARISLEGELRAAQLCGTEFSIIVRRS